MKALLITFICLFSANVALARTTTETAPNYDGLGLLALVIVGLVCLVIARRRIA